MFASEQKVHFDVDRIRKDFPILSRRIGDNPLVYLDNAASSQMPTVVMDAFGEYHRNYHSNVHRGVHTLSQEATDAFEKVRQKVQKFIGAKEEREIIYTSGATDSINLIAQSYGKTFLKEGDEILISNMEHHANIVPWDILSKQLNLNILVIPITDEGELDLNAYKNLLSERTKIVAVNHVSNALGTINPVKEITQLAHEAGAVTVIDGAQSVPHMNVNVSDIDCDFYVFSAHKMLGPTGTGILFGKAEHLEEMPPYRGGGDMILSVSFETGITYNDLPYKFEAGTPGIAQVIMLGKAIEYLDAVGRDNILAYENELLSYATQRVAEIEGLKIIGTASNKASVLSFILEGIHPHDIGTILDFHGVAVRSGHHCAQPVMERFNVPATTRASFAFYNTKSEIDTLINALHEVKEVLG
ncbi:MAG: cysteine desulfurase [Bacteroidetes bacterium]|nr:cysteine desulfurase [Bacteroidota bacterium]